MSPVATRASYFVCGLARRGGGQTPHPDPSPRTLLASLQPADGFVAMLPASQGEHHHGPGIGRFFCSVWCCRSSCLQLCFGNCGSSDRKLKKKPAPCSDAGSQGSDKTTRHHYWPAPARRQCTSSYHLEPPRTTSLPSMRRQSTSRYHASVLPACAGCAGCRAMPAISSGWFGCVISPAPGPIRLPDLS